jgi:hypothetical protein
MALPGSSFCNRQQFDGIMAIITFLLSSPSLYALYYSLPLLLFLDLRIRYPVLGYSAPSPPFSVFFFLNFPVAFNLFSSHCLCDCLTGPSSARLLACAVAAVCFASLVLPQLQPAACAAASLIHHHHHHHHHAQTAWLIG